MIGFKGKDYNYSIEEREIFYNEIYKNLPECYVLLKTCDRVELYYEDKNIGLTNECIIETINHLFGLASGVESPIIGECHILSQIKNAYQKALNENKTSKLLNILFQKAINVGKKVRSNTKISVGSPSHSLAAFNILKKTFGDLNKLRVTILGVNHLNEELIKYFYKNGVNQIFVGNRTYEKAFQLAQKYNAFAFKLDVLEEILKQTDALIVATSAPHAIVKAENIKKEMVIIDLSSPRNVDIKVKNLNNVTYFDIHDTEKMIRDSMNERLKEKEKAKKIIAREVEKFYTYLRKIFEKNYT